MRPVPPSYITVVDNLPDSETVKRTLRTRPLPGMWSDDMSNQYLSGSPPLVARHYERSDNAPLWRSTCNWLYS